MRGEAYMQTRCMVSDKYLSFCNRLVLNMLLRIDDPSLRVVYTGLLDEYAPISIVY